jgi:hypothetical protein
VIQIDGGKEFVNQKLISWCAKQGIEIQKMAPYSPLQNGITEWMNRTLVKLAQAMLIGSHLPEFLWEYMVTHASYI